MSKSGFICEICGCQDDFPSFIKLQANYGSIKYDGQTVMLEVCGECIDHMLDFVLGEVPEEGAGEP